MQTAFRPAKNASATWLSSAKSAIERTRLFATWMRCAVNESQINAAARLPLFSCMLAATITSAGFFFGKPVSGAAFWIATTVSLALAMMHSARRALEFLALTGFAWIAAAYTFSYSGWDPAVCHFPMAQAMVEGWNPVLHGTTDGLMNVLKAPCNIDHILCAPKLTAIVSACVSKATGLFTATTFLPVCIFYCTFSLARQFALTVFGASQVVAILFAFCVSMPVEIMNYVVHGTVDSVKYLSVAGSVFALVLWLRSRSVPDAMLFWLILSAAALCKTAGLAVWILLGATALAVGFREKIARRLALASVAFMLVAGASPYLTQWINGGSPFYPAHTFVTGRATKDLTYDFVTSRNKDALEMGWLGRVVYAWFSSDLATWATGKSLRKENYAPKFGWPSATGMHQSFRVMMVLSLLMLPFVRKKSVWAFCGMTFIIGNATPVRYIGFYRYFPEMYAIPFVAFMGFAYAPRFDSQWFRRIARPAVWAFLSYMTVLTVAISSTWFGFNLSLEALRQRQYAALAAKWPEARIGYMPVRQFAVAASRRMAAAGIRPVASESQDLPTVHYPDFYGWCRTMIPAESRKAAEDMAAELCRQKPAQHSLLHNFTTPSKLWKGYVSGGEWPHILFQPPPEALQGISRKGGLK